jgi:hypothetical protein
MPVVSSLLKDHRHRLAFPKHEHKPAASAGS